MSSGLLLLTVLQGIPGLLKYVFLFQSLQLTHWDKLHDSTEPSGAWRTLQNSQLIPGLIPTVLYQSFEASQYIWKEESEKQDSSE